MYVCMYIYVYIAGMSFIYITYFLKIKETKKETHHGTSADGNNRNIVALDIEWGIGDFFFPDMYTIPESTPPYRYISIDIECFCIFICNMCIPILLHLNYYHFCGLCR